MYRIFFFAGFVEILTFRFYAECKNLQKSSQKKTVTVAVLRTAQVQPHQEEGLHVDIRNTIFIGMRIMIRKLSCMLLCRTCITIKNYIHDICQHTVACMSTCTFCFRHNNHLRPKCGNLTRTRFVRGAAPPPRDSLTQSWSGPVDSES